MRSTWNCGMVKSPGSSVVPSRFSDCVHTALLRSTQRRKAAASTKRGLRTLTLRHTGREAEPPLSRSLSLRGSNYMGHKRSFVHANTIHTTSTCDCGGARAPAYVDAEIDSYKKSRRGEQKFFRGDGGERAPLAALALFARYSETNGGGHGMAAQSPCVEVAQMK